jgi:hypothetical protein
MLAHWHFCQHASSLAHAPVQCLPKHPIIHVRTLVLTYFVVAHSLAHPLYCAMWFAPCQDACLLLQGLRGGAGEGETDGEQELPGPAALLLQHSDPTVAVPLAAVLSTGFGLGLAARNLIDHDTEALETLETAVLTLVDERWTDSVTGHTALHRVVYFRSSRTLSAAHAVRLARAIVDIAPSLLTTRDQAGHDAATLAMSLPHCGALASLLCEFVAAHFFERYNFPEPLHPLLATKGSLQFAGIDRTTDERVTLSLYRRREGWENEIHQRERTPHATLAESALPVITCTALASAVEAQASTVHPAAHTSKQLRLAFVSQMCATGALVDLKRIGAQIRYFPFICFSPCFCFISVRLLFCFCLLCSLVVDILLTSRPIHC